VKKKPIVAILGCGPSGLLAAHACELRALPYVIFSNAVKSKLGGAQYSHIPIAGIHSPEPEAMLTYRVYGDAEEYKRKVYGSAPVPFVSVEKVEDGKTVPAWSLINMYGWLWNRYSKKIAGVKIDQEFMGELEKSKGIFSIIFNSLPATAICMGSIDPHINHWFRSQPILIHNEAINESLEDNTIVYDGTKEHSYYRMSKIFGHGSTEWAADGPRPPVENLRTVNKPIATNCDCHSFTYRIGRFGTWSKGELTFHAYHRVIDVLSEHGIE